MYTHMIRDPRQLLPLLGRSPKLFEEALKTVTRRPHGSRPSRTRGKGVQRVWDTGGLQAARAVFID